MNISFARVFGVCFAGCLLLPASATIASPQQADIERSRSISGTVTNSASQPLPGAIVSLAELKLQCLAEEITSGDEGGYGFPLDGRWLLVPKGGESAEDAGANA